MLVEELMLLANEHVAAFLAGRNRAALYRVHERPEPQSIALLLAKLTDLGVPTPPAPDVLSPQAAAELAGEISRRVTAYVEQSGRGREAFSDARPAGAQAGALRPAEPRSLGAREPGVLPLHLADPPLPGPRRPPRAAARARPRRRSAARRPARARRAHLGRASARRRARVPRRRDLPRLAARGSPPRARLGRAVGGRDHRPDRLGPVRALRRRLRGLPAGATTSRASSSS